ncbi:MAG: ribbon-helix-helix protein, CopG family [Chloroflexi bacterium]|nr:ribbon-helix-helix protein, CopG family [Chloroflexota bacterium]
MLYMSQRTQVYLTSEQRRRLDEIASRQRKTLAQVIREAVNAYLAEAPPESAEALMATFGVAPDIQVPSRDEWERD